jgi:hypothetical protein
MYNATAASAGPGATQLRQRRVWRLLVDVFPEGPRPAGSSSCPATGWWPTASGPRGRRRADWRNRPSWPAGPLRWTASPGATRRASSSTASGARTQPGSYLAECPSTTPKLPSATSTLLDIYTEASAERNRRVLGVFPDRPAYGSRTAEAEAKNEAPPEAGETVDDLRFLWVGVAGFEPTASSSRTPVRAVSRCHRV